MATLNNPTLPCSITPDKPLEVGTILRVKGTLKDSSFYIIYKMDDSECAMVFNPRFHWGVVVLNTMKDSVWQSEQHVPIAGFEIGKEFDLEILIEAEKFVVNLNGQFFTNYPHRLDFKLVKIVEVVGNADVSLIRIGKAFPSAPYINPAVPFTANIPGGFQSGRKLLVYGVATGDEFSVNLQYGQELLKNVAFHVKPLIKDGKTVLNSATDGKWEAHRISKVALPAGRAFAIEIVNHGDKFEAHADGNDLGNFEHRHSDDQPDTQLDTLHITGDVQLHLVHF